MITSPEAAIWNNIDKMHTKGQEGQVRTAIAEKKAKTKKVSI